MDDGKFLRELRLVMFALPGMCTGALLAPQRGTLLVIVIALVVLR